MTTRLTEELKSWIGREVTYVAPDELSKASIRLFALATGDCNPLYCDEAIARESRHGGLIAPPTFICETNQLYPRLAGEDGYFGHRFDLPIDGDRVIRGGNEYVFHKPARPDDRITVTWRITDIYERKTRKAGLLLFVVSEARYTNQHGDLLAVNRETTIR